MKNYILVFEDCSLFETILLSYFLKAKNLDVTVVADKESIKTHEGFSIVPDITVDKVDIENLNSFTITGGNPSNLTCKDKLSDLINKIYDKNEYQIGSICGGNYILSDVLGIPLDKLNSDNLVEYKNILSSPPNKYVDFAIKMGEKLKIYDDKKDLEETIQFFKN